MALHSMGRQRGDPMAVGGGSGGGGGGVSSSSSSSIALLQERFKQLEKMRERREEMEGLKLFSTTTTMATTTTTTTKTRPCFQDSSLSLGLDLFGKKTENEPSKTPPFRDFWSLDSVTVSPLCAHDKPDVDTSLHL